MTQTRPRSIAEMIRVDEKFVTDESFRRGVSYQPEPSDVFISPYAKCGTTWMQQIVHGLRSAGSMDFDEITQVVPWIEMAYDMGVDPAIQSAVPRAFKSHLAWGDIPKGGRYIVVLRDPVDAMVSLFRFLEGWWFEPGSIPLDAFAADYLEEDGGYWDHATSWLRVQDRKDVLLVTFENMKRDLPGVVARVADHRGGYPEDRIALATKQAEFSFMKAHGRQFDDHLLRAARDTAIGLPPGGEATKVATGKTKATVSDHIRKTYADHWACVMTPEFGAPDYATLEARISDAARQG